MFRTIFLACLIALGLGTANVATAIERAASLPYVYEVTKGFKECQYDGITHFEVLTNTASDGMQCVTLPTATDVPKCTLNQYVGVQNKKLVCKSISTVCDANEALTKVVDDQFTCTSLPTTEAKTCGKEEVLQSDGNNKFSCVNIGSAAIPTCKPGEVLTNLGGDVQCINTTKGFPTCTAGQALTVQNSKLVCITYTTGTACENGKISLIDHGITYCSNASCAANEFLTMTNGKPVCKAFPSVPSSKSCDFKSSDLWERLTIAGRRNLTPRPNYQTMYSDQIEYKYVKVPLPDTWGHGESWTWWIGDNNYVFVQCLDGEFHYSQSGN